MNNLYIIFFSIDMSFFSIKMKPNFYRLPSVELLRIYSYNDFAKISLNHLIKQYRNYTTKLFSRNFSSESEFLVLPHSFLVSVDNF